MPLSVWRKAILCNRIATLALAACTLFAPVIFQGQSQPGVGAQPESGSAATLQGIVRDSAKQPVAGAVVFLEGKGVQTLAAHTDKAGAYTFSTVHEGTYTVRAEMPGYVNPSSGPFFIRQKESRTIDLTLEVAKSSEQKSLAGQPEFFDEPHFTVAGVTDTTSLGGHGSDAVARNRESLAKETASLLEQSPGTSQAPSNYRAREMSLRKMVKREPQSFDANYQLGKLLFDQGRAGEGLSYLAQASRLKPGDYDTVYELALAYARNGDYECARALVLRSLVTKYHPEKAEPHHLLGEVNEKLGNPLDAVREYQRAAKLNPSETNIFDWGTELLVHRAAEPAVEVFTKGNRLFPRSVRMLVALGASLYALGFYEPAAERLCEASDLNPDDSEPYLFLGQMQALEINPSDAIAERLGRFAKLQPQNAMANYYYAVSLWKLRKIPEDAAELAQVNSLLEKAVQLDPKLGLAYLQFGLLYAEAKDSSNAISAYQKAIAATPGLEQAHYRLAQAYSQAGEASKAQAELQLYQQISKEKADQVERQRHETQQFVYELRDPVPALQPQ